MCLILVIDDDAASLGLFKTILQRAGHVVVTSNEPTQALGLVQQHQPHLLIIDDAMPHINGGELARQIKQHSHAPIILTSAGARIQDPDYVRAAQVEHVLVKPFLPRDVINAVDRVQGAIKCTVSS